MNKQILLSEDNVLSDSTSVVDPTLGGQFGPMQDTDNWASAMYHTKQRLIGVLLQAPVGMKYMQDGAYLRRALKTAMEKHATTINGLTSTQTMEVEDTPQGEGGQFMQTPTLVTIARSEPTIGFNELEGKPFTKLFKAIQTELIMEPGTTHPGIIRSDAYIAAGSPTLTPADRSFVMLFIEPNRNLTGVESAYMVANMMPLEITDEISREIGAAAEQTRLEISFTGLTLANDKVRKFAKKWLDDLNKNGTSPSGLAPFVSEIEPALRDDALPQKGSSYSKYLKASAEIAAQE